MKRQSLILLTCAGLMASVAFAAKVQSPVTPGARTLMLAHNAYPDQGKYADRLDRAIASGAPFVVEQDLIWVDGQFSDGPQRQVRRRRQPHARNLFLPQSGARSSRRR